MATKPNPMDTRQVGPTTAPSYMQPPQNPQPTVGGGTAPPNNQPPMGEVGHAAIIDGRHWDGRLAGTGQGRPMPPGYDPNTQFSPPPPIRGTFGEPGQRMPSPAPTIQSPAIQSTRQLSRTNQIGTTINAGALPSFTPVPVEAPAQAANLNVQREISATNAIRDRARDWYDPGATLDSPLAYQFTEDRLNRMLGDDSQYIRQARRTGIEQAATRGQVNSSIAAGAAMREAIRAAAPIAQSDAQFTQTEFGRGMQARYQSQLAQQANNARLREMNMGTQLEDDLAANSLVRDMDRTLFTLRGQNAMAQNDLMRRISERNAEGSIQNQMANNNLLREVERLSASARIEDQMQANTLLRDLDRQMAAGDITQQLRDSDTFRQNWLNEQSSARGLFENAFNTQLGLNAGMLERLGQAFIDDPEVFNPQAVQGMMNFFSNQTTRIIGSSISGSLGNRPPAVPSGPRGG